MKIYTYISRVKTNSEIKCEPIMVISSFPPKQMLMSEFVEYVLIDEQETAVPNMTTETMKLILERDKNEKDNQDV